MITSAVIAYQLVIFLIVFTARKFGRGSGVIVAILLFLWTLTHVFMPWLAALQFAVIAMAYELAQDGGEPGSG